MFDFDFDGEKKMIFDRKAAPYFGSYPKLADFKLVKYISKGAFGKVEQYFSPEKNEMFAIKKMKYKDRNEEQNIKDIKRQIDVLYKIDSPYVIRLYDHFEDEECVYLIMEYIDGNLYEGILKPKKELSYHIICSMIEQMCLGLEDLHKSKLIHRDLKLENIMMFNGTIKIIDLGESSHFGEGITRKTRRGTRPYFAPEILNHEEQDDRVDSWCLGVIIYEIVCLKSPFSAQIVTENDLDENIRRLRYPIPEKIKHEKELLDLFSKIFAYKNQRISIEEIRTHPWMKKYLNERAPPIKFETIFDGHEISEYREYLQSQIQKYRAELLSLIQSNEELSRQIEESEKTIFCLKQLN